jgi:hypothetical protein
MQYRRRCRRPRVDSTASPATEDYSMRKTLKTIVAVLLAVFALSAAGEAAPKKVVRHRTRHSSRVVHGATTVKKGATTVKKRAKRVAHAAATTTKKVVKRKSTTKPR